MSSPEERFLPVIQVHLGDGKVKEEACPDYHDLGLARIHAVDQSRTTGFPVKIYKVTTTREPVEIISCTRQ